MLSDVSYRHQLELAYTYAHLQIFGGVFTKVLENIAPPIKVNDNQ